MKKIILAVFTSSLLIIFAGSCSKANEDTNTGIFGKWELVESYDGYLNGGTFTWKGIPPNYQKTIRLDSSLEYIETETSQGQAYSCSGTFTYSPGDSVITTRSACNPVPTTIKVLQLNHRDLILELGVIEGVLRYKYRRG